MGITDWFKKKPASQEYSPGEVEAAKMRIEEHKLEELQERQEHEQIKAQLSAQKAESEEAIREAKAVQFRNSNLGKASSAGFKAARAVGKSAAFLGRHAVSASGKVADYSVKTLANTAKAANQPQSHSRHRFHSTTPKKTSYTNVNYADYRQVHGDPIAEANYAAMKHHSFLSPIRETTTQSVASAAPSPMLERPKSPPMFVQSRSRMFAKTNKPGNGSKNKLSLF